MQYGITKEEFSPSVLGIINSIENKVDKVEGKGLSTNDYTAADKTAVNTISSKANQSELVTLTNTVNTKVDKVEGKGLSTNDYTAADKSAISSISSKADKNHTHSNLAINDTSYSTHTGHLDMFKSVKTSIFDYTIKGKTTGGKSVGEAENNQIKFKILPVPSIITLDDIYNFMVSNYGSDGITKASYGINFTKDYISNNSVPDNTDPGYNRFIFIDNTLIDPGKVYNIACVGGQGSYALSAHVRHRDDSTTYLQVSGTVTTKCTNVKDIYFKVSRPFSYRDASISHFKFEEDVDASLYPEIVIQLDAPLRSNGNVYDELTNGKLIRRISNTGSVLETPIISDITMPAFNIVEKNKLVMNNTVTPIINFNYPNHLMGVIPKNNDAIFKLVSDVNEWNSFKNNGGTINGKISIDGTSYENNTISNFNNNTNFTLDLKDGRALVGKDAHIRNNSLGLENNPWQNLFLSGINKGHNGYTRLPNNMILQWVRVAGVFNSGSYVNTNVTLPIAMSKTLVAFANCYLLGGGDPREVMCSIINLNPDHIGIEAKHATINGNWSSEFCILVLGY